MVRGSVAGGRNMGNRKGAGFLAPFCFRRWSAFESLYFKYVRIQSWSALLAI